MGLCATLSLSFEPASQASMRTCAACELKTTQRTLQPHAACCAPADLPRSARPRALDEAARRLPMAYRQ
eukprot:1594087-Alexandrium_andersonii.AAC.1